MAQKKKNVVIQWLPNPRTMHVYSDLTEEELKSIEGVRDATVLSDNLIFAEVDPRYDPKEVAQEIRALCAH